MFYYIFLLTIPPVLANCLGACCQLSRSPRNVLALQIPRELSRVTRNAAGRTECRLALPISPSARKLALLFIR